MRVKWGEKMGVLAVNLGIKLHKGATWGFFDNCVQVAYNDFGSWKYEFPEKGLSNHKGHEGRQEDQS